MSAPRRSTRRAERRQVLLVAADAALRTIASIHLAPGGLDVVEATGDLEAYEEAASRPRVAVVVARADVPRLDAEAFLEHLRASRDARVRGLPVVLVASAPAAQLDVLCSRLPPARTLAAPVTGPRLLATLGALLGR